jgi:WD40 repeat protein/serine/threonine protein kinase
MTGPEAEHVSVEVLAEEFLARRRRGERATLEEYVARYPQLADEIREFFPVLGLVEDIKPGSDDATGSYSVAGLPVADLETRVLGDFRLIREIGRGGMGIVYEAVQESLGRHVALKVLPATAVLDQRLIRRFKREARAAAMLHHTNIVPVFGVGEHEKTCFYVMQFIQGEGLDKVIGELRVLRMQAKAPARSVEPVDQHEAGSRKSITATAAEVALALATGQFAAAGETLTMATGDDTSSDSDLPVMPPGTGNQGGMVSDIPAEPVAPRGVSLSPHLAASSDPGARSGSESRYWRELARIGLQAAEALHYAHTMGTLHRDIKPSNLLLDLHESVWLTDFGLAKAADAEDLTHTGDVLGTLRYMAPERFSGHADARSDLCSLGLTLYELLTLRPAFDETERDRLIRQVTHDEPPKPRKINPEVPRDLETIVLKSIDRDPERRYRTVGELAEELGRFLNDQPIAARPISSVERAFRWGRRNPAVATLLTAISFLLITGVVGSTLAAASYRKVAAVAEGRAEENRQRLVLQWVANGTQRMDEGDPLGALPWLVEALRLDQGDPAREEPHRLRLATVLYQCPRLLRFVLADGYVHNVYFSPDERRALTSHREGFALLWDVAAARTIGLPLQVGDQCVGAFSRDARHVVTVTKAGRTQVWDVESGRSLAPPWQTPSSAIGGVDPSLSPDGLRLLTGAVAQNGVEYRLWDTMNGRLIGEPWRLPGPGVPSVFSPDGGRLTLIVHGSPADCRDTRTAEPVDCRLREEGPLSRAIPSRDGMSLYVERMDGSYRIWDSAGDHAAWPLIENKGGMPDFVFSGDARRFVTATRDGIVTVRDVSTGEPVGPIIHRGGRPQSRKGVAISPEGRRVATIEDEHVWIWEARTGQAAGLPLRQDNPVSTVKFSPDGRLVFTTDQALTTRVFDAATGRPVGPPTRYSAQIQSTPTFSPDGQRILTVCYDQTVWVREIAPPGIPLSSLKHAGPVGSAAFSADGRRFLTISAWNPAGRDRKIIENTKAVRTWDAETGQPLAPPVMHDEQVAQATFSPDGRLVASITEHELRIWDAATGQPVRSTTRFPDTRGLQSLAFRPDGRQVVVSSRSRSLALIGVAGGPPVWESHWDNERRSFPPFFQLRFRDDGMRVVAHSPGGLIGVWDAANGQPVGPARGPFPRPLLFSPDARRVFSGSQEGKGKVWDTETGEAIPPLFEQGSPLFSPLQFSPDGRRPLTTSQQPSLTVWDVATGRPTLPPLPTGGPLGSATYSADGRRILTSAFGGIVRLWDASTGQPLSPLLKDDRFVGRVIFSPDGRRVLSIGGSPEGQPEAWLWHILPDARPIDDLTRLVTLMTGRRIDPKFGLMPSDPAEIRAAWSDSR